MFEVPPRAKWLESSADGREWLLTVPTTVEACVNRWSLRLAAPYKDSYVSIVFPATLPDGSLAVLKVQFPHAESDHEAAALRHWNGEGAARLLAEDPAHHALLIERCEPGDHLSTIGTDEALEVLMTLLPRLWMKAGEPFASLHDEAGGWLTQMPMDWERAGQPFERELLDAALEALDTLRGTQGEQILVHQDLHRDNVLRATREPWLVIDPKPLTGEREFSLAPIIRDYDLAHPRESVINRLDKLTTHLGLNRERARLWTLAQTLAWGFDGDHAIDGHVETARWLWHA